MKLEQRAINWINSISISELDNLMQLLENEFNWQPEIIGSLTINDKIFLYRNRNIMK